MKACIYENGKIFTSDKENLYAEAMLTEDGVIRKVGSREEVEKLAPQDCERVDLQGRRVIPGFVDAHMHPLMLADYSRQISALPTPGDTGICRRSYAPSYAGGLQPADLSSASKDPFH